MSDQQAPCGRRGVLSLLTTLPLLGGIGRPKVTGGSRFAATGVPPMPAQVFPQGATIVVAGPDAGRLDRWGRLIEPGLADALAPGTVVRLDSVGGADGVTGANRFGAFAVPDGRTVLLTPGEAAIAWLVGDPRAKFDVATWVPVLAGATPALLVGRPSLRSLQGGHPVRVAIDHLDSPDLAGVLALDLLGARAVPVGGIAPSGIASMLKQGTVDVVLLRGEGVAGRLAMLTQAGARPLFCLGGADDAGRPVRDPAFPSVPNLEEVYTMLHGRSPAGPIYDAWRASAAAARLVFGLVLPELTPPAMIALWRRAGADAAAARPVQAAARSAGLRPLPGPAASAASAPLAAGTPALLALRQWLVTRFNWHPS